MNYIYYIYHYTLYGMDKTIVFHTTSQASNWQWAMGKLNEPDYVAFKVTGVETMEGLGGEASKFLNSI